MSRIKKAVELDKVDDSNTVSIRSDATFPNRVRTRRISRRGAFGLCAVVFGLLMFLGLGGRCTQFLHFAIFGVTFLNL